MELLALKKSHAMPLAVDLQEKEVRDIHNGSELKAKLACVKEF